MYLFVSFQSIDLEFSFSSAKQIVKNIWIEAELVWKIYERIDSY